MEGIIHRLQRFSVDDGPGIRTTLFFKGCPLRCSWCANPETQRLESEILFFADRCIQKCNQCMVKCPLKAIHRSVDGELIIDRKLCNGCGQCVKACYTSALEKIGRIISPEEILNELKRDLKFFKESKGGVTLSGGEPLYQIKFCFTLLSLLKTEGIHTALDTCGYYMTSKLSYVLDVTDLFLYDLKIIDDKKHQAYTGFSNSIILENARFLSRSGKDVILRYPLIPGVNTEPSDITSLVEFILSLDRPLEVNLLPYHRLGVLKYAASGRTYQLDYIVSPDQAQLNDALNIFRDAGISARCL